MGVVASLFLGRTLASNFSRIFYIQNSQSPCGRAPLFIVGHARRGGDYTGSRADQLVQSARTYLKLRLLSKKIISKKIFDFLRYLRVFRRKTRTYIIFFRSALPPQGGPREGVAYPPFGEGRFSLISDLDPPTGGGIWAGERTYKNPTEDASPAPGGGRARNWVGPVPPGAGETPRPARGGGDRPPVPAGPVPPGAGDATLTGPTLRANLPPLYI